MVCRSDVSHKDIGNDLPSEQKVFENMVWTKKTSTNSGSWLRMRIQHMLNFCFFTTNIACQKLHQVKVGNINDNCLLWSKMLSKEPSHFVIRQWNGLKLIIIHCLIKLKNKYNPFEIKLHRFFAQFNSVLHSASVWQQFLLFFHWSNAEVLQTDQSLRSTRFLNLHIFNLQKIPLPHTSQCLPLPYPVPVQNLSKFCLPLFKLNSIQLEKNASLTLTVRLI